MDVKQVKVVNAMSAYAVAKWLKEEKCVNPSFHGSRGDMIKSRSSRSRAEIIFNLLRCGKYNFIPTWFSSEWKIVVSEEDWRKANVLYGVIHYCAHSTKSGKIYFKMPATAKLIEVIEERIKKYKTNDSMYVLPFDEKSHIFCPPETNGYFNPDLYYEDNTSSDVKETLKTMWNTAKNLVGNNNDEVTSKEEDKTETITELEKYKTALKALAMAYSKYSQRNADQILRLILKKAEENYEEVNKSYEFWVKLNKDIKSIKKVDFIN